MKKMYVWMALSLLCATGMRAAVPTSGSFDELNSYWNLEDGVLTIGVLDDDPENDFEGCGGIPDFESTSDVNIEEGLAPWYPMRQSIDEIVIEEGIVKIGKRAFAQCWYAEKLTLPKNILLIDDYAFLECYSLPEDFVFQEITLREDDGELKRMRLGDRVFTGCPQIKTITCHQSLAPRWYGDPFEGLEVEKIALYVPAEYIEEYLYYEHANWEYLDVRTLPSPADDLCEVTSTGLDFEFVHSQIMPAIPVQGASLIGIFLFEESLWYEKIENADMNLITPTDGKALRICILADDPDDLRGSYDDINGKLALQSFTGTIVREDGEVNENICTGGSVIISVNEEGTGYDIVYSLVLNENGQDRRIEGTVSGLCADNIPQGIENVQSDKVQGAKMLRDGMLFFERDGKVFNAQGAQVK